MGRGDRMSSRRFRVAKGPSQPLRSNDFIVTPLAGGASFLFPFYRSFWYRSMRAYVLIAKRHPTRAARCSRRISRRRREKIEKIDPLWGDSCVFSHRYRSECMESQRPQLARRLPPIAVHHDWSKRNTYDINLAEGIDENAAALDDVLTPDAQKNIVRSARRRRGSISAITTCGCYRHRGCSPVRGGDEVAEESRGGHQGARNILNRMPPDK